MNKMIGFFESTPKPCQGCADAQTMTLTVRSFRRVDPAKRLLDAANYSDNSLQHALNKAKACKRLGIDSYYEAETCGEVDLCFEFQGEISTGRWYCCHLERVDMQAANIKAINAIVKHLGGKEFYELESPDVLKTALLKMRAISMQYESDWVNYSIDETKLGQFYIDPKQTEALAA